MKKQLLLGTLKKQLLLGTLLVAGLTTHPEQAVDTQLDFTQLRIDIILNSDVPAVDKYNMLTLLVSGLSDGCECNKRLQTPLKRAQKLRSDLQAGYNVPAASDKSAELVNDAHKLLESHNATPACRDYMLTRALAVHIIEEYIAGVEICEIQKDEKILTRMVKGMKLELEGMRCTEDKSCGRMAETFYRENIKARQEESVRKIKELL